MASLTVNIPPGRSCSNVCPCSGLRSSFPPWTSPIQQPSRRWRTSFPVAWTFLSAAATWTCTSRSGNATPFLRLRQTTNARSSLWCVVTVLSKLHETFSGHFDVIDVYLFISKVNNSFLGELTYVTAKTKTLVVWRSSCWLVQLAHQSRTGGRMQGPILCLIMICRLSHQGIPRCLWMLCTDQHIWELWRKVTDCCSSVQWFCFKNQIECFWDTLIL